MCFHRRRIPKHLLLQPSPLPRRRSHRILKWVLGSVLVLLTLAIANFTQAATQPGEAGIGLLLFSQQQGFNAALHLASQG